MHALWNQLERAARLRGGDRAITCDSDVLSWSEARDLATRMASVLRDRGIRDGARVAFVSPNSINYMLMPFATEIADGIFVPINSRLAVPEIVAQLEDVKPELLIAARPFVDLARDAAAKAGIPVLETDGPEGFDAMAGRASPLPLAVRAVDRPVAIYYTGGTTGRAKGVVLTGDRLVMNSLQWTHAVSARHDENLLVVAPMFHMVAALNAVISCVLACDLTILDRFTPEGTLAAIENQKVTNMGLVPAMIDLLITAEGFAERDLSSLRTLTYGGSPISQKTLAATLENLPHVRLYHIYGQTEGGPTISALPPEWHSTDPACASKLRSVGRPLVLTDVRIVRPDNTDCGCGERGEIVVRGPAVSPGYWNRPEETAAAFQSGWLHTGDAGYLDEDGYLFIVDRIKDMIVSGGENVYAVEVERVILQHPAVEECVVIGVPSNRWGEAVHAIVRLRDVVQADELEIIAFCRERISAFKSPRSVEFRREPFPLSGAGKIDKRSLRLSHSGSDPD